MTRYRAVAVGSVVAGLAGVGFIVPGPTTEGAEAGVVRVELPAMEAPPPAEALVPTGADVSAEADVPSEAVAASSERPEPAIETFTGSASYYADKFEGRTTASGVPFRQSRLWAAHKTLPFGTRLRVTNLANGHEVEVEVVDRGPYARGRILDLSRTAANRLDFIRSGHTRVKIEVLEKP